MKYLICFLLLGCASAKTFSLEPCNEYQEQAAISLADGEYGTDPLNAMDWFREAKGKASSFFNCELSTDVDPAMDRWFLPANTVWVNNENGCDCE